MKSFKQYFKEETGDFGDDAEEFSKKQELLNLGNPKEKQRWREARGFIEPSGRINRIDRMPHEHYAMDLGHSTMVNGKMVNKKYDSVKELGVETGLIRWSPETNSFAVYKEMTAEQIKVIKTILKAYGFYGLTVEYLNKLTGQMETVEFNDAAPRQFDSKIMRVQSRVK
jgi:hypothetical protein